MWVKLIPETSSTATPRILYKSERTQLFVDAPTVAGTHDITQRSQTERAAFDRVFYDAECRAGLNRSKLAAM